MSWDKTRIRNYGIAEAEKGIKRGKGDKRGKRIKREKGIKRGKRDKMLFSIKIVHV